MARAWLGLGANLGDPKAQLRAAIARLDGHPRIAVIKQSTIIATKPWGKTDQPDFHNMAAVVETDLLPEELLAVCQSIEADMGRTRSERWGPRLIDIDIIAYDRLERETDGLILPHPHAHERDFVLVPLREIAPDVAEWIMANAGKG